MSTKPYIDKSIILYLEDTYPLTSYNNLTDHDKVLRYQGVQTVISHLRSLQEHFEKTGNILNV